MTLKNNIKKIRRSIIAIGFQPNPKQVTIIGSGFAVDKDGKILSSAHLYNQVKPEYREQLMGMTMSKQEKNGLEHYTWLPLKLIKKDNENDMALYQIKGYEKTLLQPLELGDSETIEVGEEIYFIGFPYAAQLINDGFGITLIVNKGIISNIKQDGATYKRNWFIIDAISNPGNSGCPLIKLDTNEVIGIMTLSFRTKSKTIENLDIREPMHICAAKPINLDKNLLEE
jgi:putative serine protease PepD